MNMQIKTCISLVLFIPIWFFGYIFLHEAGHALVGMAYGGTIERFVFWNLGAYVRIVSANITVFGQALMSAAGTLFPRVLFLIALGFYNAKIKFAGYHLCYVAAVLGLVGGALVLWVAMPIGSLFTPIPANEDSIFFMEITGFHPVLVTLISLLLIGAFTLFAHSRGVFAGAWLAYNALLGKEVAIKSTKIKWGLVSIGLALSAVLAVAAAIIYRWYLNS